MRKRTSLVLGAALLAVGLLASVSPAGAAPSRHGYTRAQVLAYLHQHGYLPIKGPAVLAAAKAHAAALVAAQHPGSTATVPHGAAPTIGTSWQGISDSSVAPPDANGAIGPKGYVEIINLKIGLYNRTGGLVSSGTLGQLTGHSNFSLSDPMVLWDPDTQRFYFNVWDVNQATMVWGFSKDNNPTSVTSSWCKYTTAFGYTTSNFPDYPKLGQTKGFLTIGVNFYPTGSNLHATESDLLWTSKPQGSGPITTCPAASTFKSGKFKDLRNQDGTQAFTPVPAIQTDPSANGYIMAMSDIECPDICGSGTQLTVYQLKPKKTDPTVPVLGKPHSITVGSFTSPPDAPQKGTTRKLDTLDGRLTHAVSGIDPTTGKVAVWVGHTVMGGAGAEVRWYEVNPTPLGTPTLQQSGAATNGSLYVFDAGISNDRTCNGTTCAHGSAMVLGFTTSSSGAFPASQMVSKIGAGAQSAFVLVKQSTTSDNDFTCSPCRWGDYGGATPDPAASIGASTGVVWLTNEWTNGTNQTWNWEATP